MIKLVFDKFLSLPVGAHCVESGVYGDKFGVSVSMCLWVLSCVGERQEDWQVGERRNCIEKVEERDEIDGMFSNIRHNREMFSRSLCVNARPWFIYSFSHYTIHHVSLSLCRLLFLDGLHL